MNISFFVVANPKDKFLAFPANNAGYPTFIESPLYCEKYGTEDAATKSAGRNLNCFTKKARKNLRVKKISVIVEDTDFGDDEIAIEAQKYQQELDQKFSSLFDDY